MQVLIKKITPYIYTLFFICFFNKAYAQKLILNITSKDSIEKSILTKINFKKEHLSLNNLLKETSLISDKLKTRGYFYNSIDSLTKKDSTHTCFFSLGNKIDKVIIKTSSKTKVELKPKQIETYLNSITNKLEREGKSFSKIRLKNIKIKNNIVFAELKTQPSQKRRIDRTIVMDYSDFPKSYIKHYFNIKSADVFNKKRLEQISTKTKFLPFVEEIKSPEILFSKDSTLLYMYLKKKNSNFFDGLISFNSKEKGKGLIFNGYLHLKLNNTLNSGEQLELLWQANGKERQQFKISSKIPYIFNTPLSSVVNFSIHKQDSSFLNTKFHSKLSYSISHKTSLSATFDREKSENTLKDKSNTLINSYSSSFIGLDFLYRKPIEYKLFDNKYYFRINPSLGNRENNGTKTNQIKINLEFTYLWKIINRNFLYFRNHSSYLNSKNFLQNELFRIGGIKSIRGINEESLFARKFSYINIEYRYLTSNKSYLYSISDLGISNNIGDIDKKHISLGAGYLFFIKNSQINLSYILNTDNLTNFNLNKSKFNFTLKSFF